MNVYECGKCGELDVERPTHVQVLFASDDKPVRGVWLCRPCHAKARRSVAGVGRWTNNGYTWTSADGTTIDFSPLSSKRFPGAADRGEAEG